MQNPLWKIFSQKIIGGGKQIPLLNFEFKNKKHWLKCPLVHHIIILKVFKIEVSNKTSLVFQRVME